jgi:hypothetical protein
MVVSEAALGFVPSSGLKPKNEEMRDVCVGCRVRVQVLGFRV